MTDEQPLVLVRRAIVGDIVRDSEVQDHAVMVTDVDADPELDAAVLRQAGVALDHAVLDLDRAANSVHDAAEFDDRSVARALDDTTVMYGNCGIDQIATQGSQPRENSVLVGPGKRLFGSGTTPGGMQLVDSRTSSTGVVMATYRRAGRVNHGSFEFDTPTDEELERRRRLAAEG